MVLQVGKFGKKMKEDSSQGLWIHASPAALLGMAGGSCQIEFIFRQSLHWHTLGSIFWNWIFPFAFCSQQENNITGKELSHISKPSALSFLGCTGSRSLTAFSLIVVISILQLASVAMDMGGRVMGCSPKAWTVFFACDCVTLFALALHLFIEGRGNEPLSDKTAECSLNEVNQGKDSKC